MTGLRTKLTLIVAVLGLTACATPFRAEVSRFQTLPQAQGQSFTITTRDAALQGGLEFGQYADLVAGRMAALGYQPASDSAAADLVVYLDYDIDKGRERIVSSPGIGFHRGFFHGGSRGFYRRSAFRFGFHDPFLYGGHGFGGFGDVSSFTVYTTELDLQIERRVDGARLFEGKAQAQSRSRNLTYLVPNLVEAMFTDFPGSNGETVKISVAPEKRG